MASAEEWKRWEHGALKLLGAGIRAAREDRGLSQTDLAKKAGVSKGLIMNIEASSGDNPRLQSLPSIATLTRLALAVGRPPIELLYPSLPDGEVDVWPGIGVPSITAAQWFSGEIPAHDVAPIPLTEGSTNLLIAASRRRERLAELSSETARKGVESLQQDGEIMQSLFDELNKIKEDRAALEEIIRKLGGTVNDD